MFQEMLSMWRISAFLALLGVLVMAAACGSASTEADVGQVSTEGEDVQFSAWEKSLALLPRFYRVHYIAIATESLASDKCQRQDLKRRPAQHLERSLLRP